MTPERKQRLEEVLGNRQPDLAIVLEEVHDPHNIYAAMRSADAVGVKDLYVIHQGKSLRWPEGRRSSGTAFKWLDVHHFHNLSDCMELVTNRYDRILGTHLEETSRELYELDLTGSVALVFGNEHKGISGQMLPYIDVHFRIPMVGMIPSLNISVACAVTLYEAFRQRKAAGHYDRPKLKPKTMEQIMNEWKSK